MISVTDSQYAGGSNSGSRRIVYLIGLPACGKTTLGRALGPQMESMGLEPAPFFDLDEAIEDVAGMSVAHIFETQGEAAFRRLESETLHRLSEQESAAVIACGGGTPCSEANIGYMLGKGLVVELRATREATLRRLLEAPAGQRPLVKRFHGDPEALAAEVDSLSGRRARWYSRAHARFDSSRLESPEEIAITARNFINRFLICPPPPPLKSC